MTDLNPFLLGGAVSEGDGISDTGLVAGLAYSSSAPNERAAIYNVNTGVTTDLTTVPGFINGLNSWTYAVNNSGQAVGWSAASYPFFYNGSTTTQTTRSRRGRQHERCLSLFPE